MVFARAVPRGLRWSVIVLLLAQGCVTLAHADTADSMPVISIAHLRSQLVRAPAEFLVAPQRHLAVAALPREAFHPLTGDDVNRGITGADYWIRLRLSNETGSSARAWVLADQTSYLDHLTVYCADNGGRLQRTSLSDRVPFHDRPLDYRTLAFPHTTPAGGYTDLYIRMGFDKPDSLTLNLRLARADQFQETARRESLIHGAFYGIMGAFLLIAVIAAFILRQSVYLYYAAFLTASIAMWAQLNGYAFEYLWPRAVYWHNEGFHIVFLLMAITALQFSRRFLQMARHFPRTDRGIRIAQWVLAGGIALRVFAGVYVPILALSYAALTSLVLLAALGLKAYRRGLRYARWYALAWLLYGFGLGFSVLCAGTSLLEWGMTPLAYAQGGSVIEAGFLLVALGERLISWDRARRRALEIANQDPLTGLGNRRALHQAFDALRDQAQATNQPVFLAFIDLDHFKAINDRFGHDAGDAVLVHLAQVLRSGCRERDVCIRYGGEEFAILLQAPHRRHAVEVIERIRNVFASHPTRFQGMELTHTLTAGITLAVSARGDLDRAEAVRQADHALYEGKRDGRNRCVFHEAG